MKINIIAPTIVKKEENVVVFAKAGCGMSFRNLHEPGMNHQYIVTDPKNEISDFSKKSR